MPKYQVTMPFAGSFSFEVEAESKEDAIARAYDVNMKVEVSDDQPDGIQGAICDDWDMLEHITRGNVCSAPVNDAYAELMEDDDAQ